jgi:uncharacterized protein YggE
MMRRWSVLAGLCLAMAAAVPAAAQTGSGATSPTITATGTGRALVTPANRHSNSSISRAYAAAARASIPNALRAAHTQALAYAAALHLTLGPLLSVTDQSNSGFYGPTEEYAGPFGPGRFCGIVRQAIIKTVNGHRKVVGTRKVHRCIVPQIATTTLALTYSAS